MMNQVRSRSLVSEAVLCCFTRRREAAVGLLLLVATAAFGSRDQGVYGSSMFDLRLEGEQVRLAASSPAQVTWNAKFEWVNCVSKRPLAPTAWVDGSGLATIMTKPPSLNLCSSVDTIHVTNTGTAPVAALWAERVAAGTPVAASLPVELNPGETARIAHTGEVGIYVAGNQHPIRQYRR